MDSVSTIRASTCLAQVDRFFSEDVKAFQEQLAALDAKIDPTAIPVPGDAIHREVLAALDQSIAACARFEAEHGHDERLLREVQAGFRQETAAWFDRSWFANRSRSKPTGFAGDYEMLLKLYQQQTTARGLGGYLDLCLNDLQLARAVRARMQAAREFLTQEMQGRSGDLRILDIASGPCQEYLGFPAEACPGQVEIVAMDNDPLALEYVASTVVPQLPESMALQPTRYNALRTRSAEATTRKFGWFDIVYSVGLFDYLPDDLLIDILAALPKMLRGDGVVYIGFKDTERYDKTPYQWHLDWFFFQRTKEDCLRLYEQAGIRGETVETVRDETGIIMNFISRRAAGNFVRRDLPESILQPVSTALPMGSPSTPND